MPSRDQVINYAANEARRQGLPPSWFLAMLHGESGFREEVGRGDVKSRTGAIGYGQLMPGTARGLGVDPYNWQQNIRGAAMYLKRQYDSFKTMPLALSAYNSGPGGSEASGKIEGFAETQAYVKRVSELEAQYRSFNTLTPSAPGEAGVIPSSGPATPPQLTLAPTTPAPSRPYLDALTRTGPLSARVAAQASRFEPRRPMAAQTPTATSTTQPRFTPQNADATMINPNPDDGWAGSYSMAKPFADLGVARGLSIVSEKRDRQNTKSNLRSDHWKGSKDSYAFDLSDGHEPTPAMDQAAIDIVSKLGGTYDGKGELNFTTTINGYRYQVLYRTQVGGNHGNHIHVGVRKVKTSRKGGR